MNRRNFLQTLVGGVAAAAAVRTFPFRVFSFPKEVVSGVGPLIFDAHTLHGYRYDPDFYRTTGVFHGIARCMYSPLRFKELFDGTLVKLIPDVTDALPGPLPDLLS